MPMIHEIALDQILPDPDNPRSGNLEGIEALAANIYAVGLLNPITVREYAPDGHGDKIYYMIVAGHRRYAAAQLNGWRTVQCTIIKHDTPLELALTENIMRQNMHPVDEHRAFVKLKLGGMSVKKIAKHFGVDDRTVKQRLALGSIIPEFLEYWRQDKIEWDSIKQLAQMKPGKQKEALVKAEEQLVRFDHIEEWLIDSFVSKKGRTYLDTEKVRFVGLEDYEKAGGRIDEDLFGDEQWIADTVLLDSLYDRKQLEVREAALAEGWRSVRWEKSTPSLWESHTRIHELPSGIEDDEKAAIDLVLLVAWDGEVQRQYWKDKPKKEEEDRPATYGSAPQPGQNGWDAEVKIKQAAVARYLEFRRLGWFSQAAAEYLIARIQAIEPPKVGTVPDKELPEPVRVPIDDDPPETELPEPPPGGEEEVELVDDAMLVGEFKDYLDGEEDIDLGVLRTVMDAQAQHGPTDEEWMNGMEEAAAEWIDPPAGEGEVSPGDTGEDHDTEQGAADRPARKRPRGTKAQRGRSRRKLQSRNEREVA